jgi:hypothetical protein
MLEPTSATSEDDIYAVPTVPPPQGEADVYSAVTRLHATPLHLMLPKMAQPDAPEKNEADDEGETVLYEIDPVEQTARRRQPRTEPPPAIVASQVTVVVDASPSPGRERVTRRLTDRMIVIADLAVLGAVGALAVLALCFS